MIKGFGELALRVRDLETMKTFYKDVVGLEVYADPEPYFVFFKLADAEHGHPQILGLFDRQSEVDTLRSSLDHFAFIVDLDDQETLAGRLASHSVEVVRRTFPHFGWRSLFFSDPEGNTVEFVSYDPSV